MKNNKIRIKGMTVKQEKKQRRGRHKEQIDIYNAGTSIIYSIQKEIETQS